LCILQAACGCRASACPHTCHDCLPAVANTSLATLTTKLTTLKPEITTSDPRAGMCSGASKLQEHAAASLPHLPHPCLGYHPHQARVEVWTLVVVLNVAGSAPLTTGNPTADACVCVCVCMCVRVRACVSAGVCAPSCADATTHREPQIMNST